MLFPPREVRPLQVTFGSSFKPQHVLWVRICFPYPGNVSVANGTTIKARFNIWPKAKGCVTLLKWTVLVSYCSCIVRSRTFKETEVSCWNAHLLPPFLFPPSAVWHSLFSWPCFNSNPYTLHSRWQHYSSINKTPLRKKKKVLECYWNTVPNLKSVSSSNSFWSPSSLKVLRSHPLSFISLGWISWMSVVMCDSGQTLICTGLPLRQKSMRAKWKSILREVPKSCPQRQRLKWSLACGCHVYSFYTGFGIILKQYF